MDERLEGILGELLMEASKDTYYSRDEIYIKVANVLSTPVGDRKFRKIVENYMDRNSSKIYTPGPLYLITFGDVDKAQFFNLFGITATEVKKCVVKITQNIADRSDFKLLRNNPIFWVLYAAIRYYTLVKDKAGLNIALAIYALSVYPSVYSLYFKYGVNEQIMQYTINNLSNKFLIKVAGNLFNGLFMSIQNSYDFLKEDFQDGSDLKTIRFIQRIRNDQKSMIRNITDKYMVNAKENNRVRLTKDTFDDEMVFDPERQNDSSIIEAISNKVTRPLLTSSVDMGRAKQAAMLSGISISETRYYMTRIISDKNFKLIGEFIQSIVFLFIYEDKNRPEDINSSRFLVWASELFRKTNSNDKNIATIKDTLNYWAEDSGITKKFKREASRVNYKKAIFFYFVLSIQHYNG